MADVQHSTLPDNRLHYPKGATGATNGTVCTANGDGTTSFLELRPRNIEIEDVLILEDFNNQGLTTQGDEAKITYVATDTTSPNGSVTVEADGDIVINESGIYFITGAVEVGRTTSVGVAEVWFALRTNGVQTGRTTRMTIESSGTTFANPIFTASIADIPAGTTLSFHMLRTDSQSGNAGIYSTTSTTSGWLDSSSVKLTIHKLGVD